MTYNITAYLVSVSWKQQRYVLQAVPARRTRTRIWFKPVPGQKEVWFDREDVDAMELMPYGFLTMTLYGLPFRIEQHRNYAVAHCERQTQGLSALGCNEPAARNAGMAAVLRAVPIPTGLNPDTLEFTYRSLGFPSAEA